jgi:16S rRNA (uracil1498-N3)-methyltransferase
MRRHRVRVGELAAGERRLVGPAAHHLARVLRVQPGDPVAAFDGRGREARGEVVTVQDDAVVLRLGEPGPIATEPDRPVTLAPALLKGDKLADVVRMATELGVVAVRPLRTRRCDVPVASPAKLARWRRVAEEAARQCGRARVPEVADAVALAGFAWTGALLVADPNADATLHDALAALPERDVPVTVVTGPEGGLTEAEVADLVARGGVAVTLGRRVLRAETAPVAAAAALLVPEAS